MLLTSGSGGEISVCNPLLIMVVVLQCFWLWCTHGTLTSGGVGAVVLWCSCDTVTSGSSVTLGRRRRMGVTR